MLISNEYTASWLVHFSNFTSSQYQNFIWTLPISYRNINYINAEFSSNGNGWIIRCQRKSSSQIQLMLDSFAATSNPITYLYAISIGY